MDFSDYFKINYENIVDDENLKDVISVIRDQIDWNYPIYIIGNGGSAYSGSHFSQDLNKLCKADSSSLTENIGLILAIANDISFNDIFEVQLKYKKCDSALLIAVSCSGNSENIIRAVEYAKNNDMFVIGFTGFGGGKLGKLCDIEVNISYGNIYTIESWHSIIMHYIVDELSKEIL